MNPIKILYIYHDCFLVRTPGEAMLFDFWKDPYQRGHLPNVMMDIDPEMPLYVFVSHGHKDHYNPVVFDWSRHFSNIRYIVSADVRARINHIVSDRAPYRGIKVDPSKVITLAPGDHYDAENIHIDAFASTDIGNSYAVSVGEYKIFHAGDLNAWLWMDESTPEEVAKAAADFEDILMRISAKYSAFDIAFFPVDSRIGTGYFTGAKIFLEKFGVNTFFPMHYELADDITQIAQRHKDAADFDRYASPLCHNYVMSAPYSAYSLIK